MKNENIHDVMIIGAGPSGLSAALLLGRCMRKVLLCDSGDALAGSGASTSGFIGYDGSHPVKCLETGRAQLAKFGNVTHLRTTVEDIERDGFVFGLHAHDGKIHRGKAVLLALDLDPELPPVFGAERFYGTSLHQEPYCDGWEHQGKKIGVLGADAAAVGLARKLMLWSPQITLFTHGVTKIDAGLERRLRESAIQVVTGAVIALEGEDDRLEWLRMEDGSTHDCEALFYSSARKFDPWLATRLGCDLSLVGKSTEWRLEGGTGVEGFFVAGNPLHPSEFAVVAAADGVKAAEAVNNWLVEADHSYLALEPA